MTGALLIRNGTVVTMDPERRIVANGAVCVRGSRIEAIGKSVDLDKAYPDVEMIDATGMLVIPGLIDGHNHPAHYLNKGLLDDMAVKQRWSTRLYPLEESMSDEEAYWGSLASFAEMIMSGTTCVADPGSFHTEATLKAATEIGIRAVVAPSVRDISDAIRPTHDQRNLTPDAIAAECEDLYGAWNGTADGRIRIWFGLRQAGNVSDELCGLIRDLAEKYNVGIHTHLAISAGENRMVEDRWGCRGIERFRRLELLRPNLYAAHMGAIEDDELEVVCDAGLKIAHCPSASMLGGFGCISHGRFPELIASGVTVSIGTDAGAISRFLDMVREMYLAACAHKDARADPEAMGAHKAFEMGTIDGARALMWDDEIGSLEPGKRADLAMVRTDSLEWQPRPDYNPVANLIYSASGASVDSVMIDGKFVMRGRRLLTVDERDLVFNVTKAATATRERAGVPEIRYWPVV